MSKPLYIDWYPQAALDGMNQLSALEELAYRRILDFIFVTDDNLLDDDKQMAWMTKTGKGWKKIKARLIELGKIEVSDTKIRNRKAGLSLSQSRHRIEQKKEAGKASASARNNQKNNNTGSTAVATEPPTSVQTPVPSDVTTSEPTNYQLSITSQSTKHHHQSNNSARADEPPIDDDVDEVILIFEEERKKVYGTARDKPRNDDRQYAQLFLSAGADLDLIRKVFHDGFQRCFDSGKDVPGGLKYFESEMKTRLTKPKQEQAPKSIPTPLNMGDIVNPEWREIVERLRTFLGDAIVKSWIIPLRFISCQGGELQVEAPNRFIKEWVTTNHSEHLRKAANANSVRIFINTGSA